MKTRVRRDLHSHADEKLYKWVTDTFEIYLIADLDPTDAAADTIFSMFTAIGALAAAFNIPEEILTEFFCKNLRSTKRKYKAQESQQ
jgi:hypothetical protein